ncbi:actin-related protein 10 [Anoplophora glabripennis]|uniref:actin-related protein 10 n=1 Tax=Anoplophora glabripennis TaxID=217634 RepID=UPI000873A1FF|nr:actin-related protein 10 [Anoplophora glabripennis]
MPIYETLTSDKLVVVLDIGAAFTKFGFTGEFAPRNIIKSEVRCKKTGELKRLWDFKTPDELYDLLVEFIHIIYFKFALLSPKDRPIVIVESLLCPTLFRETLAKVLFIHYEISSMLVLPSHLICLSSIAVDTAVVVDVGYKEAVVIPVCYGLPIVQAWQALPLGAEAIHNNLKTALSSNNTGIQNIPESTLEDVKIRCCFITKKSRAEQLALVKPEITPCPEVKYPLGGSESITVTGKVRERAFEILYEEDNDHLCLSTMILDAILHVDRDLRQKLAENLVLIGGTTMARGFKARLKEELEKQLKFDRYKKLNITKFAFHTLPCKENYAAWLGGAIYGATELLNMKTLTKENYFKENRLPDWINLKDNIRTL